MVILEWVNANGWIMTVIALLAGAFLTKRRELYLKLAEKKGEHYSKYFDILYAPQFNDRLYYYQKTNIVLYGSREVLEKLAVCEKNGISITDQKRNLEFYELIYEMKKDIEKPRLTLSLFKRIFHKNNLEENVKDILFDYKKKSN
ncbi:hypothetical protein [Piscibacillus salipiscarius]|uniref:Uncharacterized protein n=1 Tax=Piscibacillus salipiscarius TaxID=299480 RepID=A0ABW5QEQ8_9BACI